MNHRSAGPNVRRGLLAIATLALSVFSVVVSIRADAVLSGPGLKDPGSRVRTPVSTASVAPTILAALGLDPGKLEAVRIQGTPCLPGIGTLRAAAH